MPARSCSARTARISRGYNRKTGKATVLGVLSNSFSGLYIQIARKRLLNYLCSG